MKRIHLRSTTALMQRALLSLGGLTFMFVALLSITVPATPIARASDPTLDAALAAIAQATAQAQQTRDAREQDLANQRATAAAIDLAQRRQAATWTAQAQARDAEATQVARSATAIAAQTQVAQTAQAQAIQQTATANASATSVGKTRVFEQAQSDNATRTTQQIQALQTASAQQTQTAQQRQAAAEERDANVRTGGIALILSASAMMLLALARWVWIAARPRTVVEVVEDVTAKSQSSSSDELPIVERIPQDPGNAEPIFDAESNTRAWTDPPTDEPPPVRVIIDDDIAAQAQTFNDLLKEQPSQVNYGDKLNPAPPTE